MAIIILVGLTRIVVEGRGGTDDRFVGHSCGRGIYGDRFCGEGGHGLLLCVVGGYPYFRHGFLRPLFWYMLLAILISLAGSVVVILYLAYEYGGINLSRWFFGGGTRAPFDYITTKLNVPTGFNLDGWVHTCVSGGIMVLLVLARQALLRWPLHPIGVVWLMDQLWFSIF